jgi:hypothetical protein
MFSIVKKSIEGLRRSSRIAKIKKPEKRTLNLNITEEDIEVPKIQSVYFDEIIEETDRYTASNKIYDDLYVPNDELTKETINIIKKIKHIDLPDTFFSNIALYELKKDVKIKQKQQVFLDKLTNKEYETKSSKSDYNIVSYIKSWTNNYPSFKQYKDENNLQYIFDNHRLLFLELLNHIHNNTLKLTTLKGNINTILRVIKLGYSNTHPVYEKYWTLLQNLSKKITENEGQNKLNEIEEKTFLDWEVILKERNEMIRRWNSIDDRNNKGAFQLNQDILLVGIYTYLAPLRNEVKTLTIETVKKPTGDFIWNKEDMVLVLNEIKKKHKRIELDIPKEFQNILKESFKLYPRKYLFTNVNAFPDITKQATINTLSTRLLKIYSKYGKNVGTNSLRSSYVSYFFKQAILKTGNPPSDTSVRELSVKMRTSNQMIYNNYRKDTQTFRVLPISNVSLEKSLSQPITVEVVVEEPIVEEVVVEPIKNVKTSYEKKKERMKKYYEDNKEQLKKKIIENRKSPDKKYNRQRRELLNKLNNIDGYDKVIKKESVDKYKFKKNNEGKWE